MNEINANEPKVNGVHASPKADAPQPAPRRLNAQNTDVTQSQQNNVAPKILKSENIQSAPPASESLPIPNHKKATPTSSLEGDDNQVLPRPITNEEFQAMIPVHFLKSAPISEPSHAVTVTIHKPDPIELPPAPTGPGRVTETITKSTFTETVVTRITDNMLNVPVIIEVCPLVHVELQLKHLHALHVSRIKKFIFLCLAWSNISDFTLVLVFGLMKKVSSINIMHLPAHCSIKNFQNTNILNIGHFFKNILQNGIG